MMGVFETQIESLLMERVTNTDHPAFRSWFGKSVLRKGGKPMPLFHGTSSSRFDRFEKREGNRYILFSEIKVQANGFFFAERESDAREFGRNVVRVYVRMEKPMFNPLREKYIGINDLSAKRLKQLTFVAAPMVEKDKYGSFIEVGVQKIYLTDENWPMYLIDEGGLVWDMPDNPGVVGRLKQAGFDGTFVHEKELQMGRSIFVPNTSQIVMDTWL